jgi:hypothetical protein
MNPFGFIFRLKHVLGWRFLLFLCASQLCLKGAAYYLSAEILLPLLKNVFGIDAYNFQLYVMLTMMPWSLKPLMGLVSDTFLIGGYHKRFWLLFSIGVGLCGSSLVFLGLSLHSPRLIVFCFTAVQFQVAFYDLMSEGAYSAQMRLHPQTGSDLIVLTQVFQHVGGIFATCLVGPLSDHSLFIPLLVINVVMCSLPLLPSLLNWIGEEKNPYGIPHGQNLSLCNRLGVHRVVYEQLNPWMIGVIAFTGVAAPISATVSALGDATYGLALAIILTCVSLLGAYHVFPTIVFHVALYQVVSIVCAPSLSGAMDYFYTADEACNLGGPHFSYAYYQTYAGIVGTMCSLAGSFLYKALLSKMRFRRVFILTAILNGLIGLSDLMIVLRVNRKLGIPDHVAYIVGEAVFEPVFTMLYYIPCMALVSRSCVQGMEASTFAFLAGTANFAFMISRLSGALIFQSAGIKTQPPCNFDHLWILILVCHCLSPLIIRSVASVLIPDTHQDATETITVPDMRIQAWGFEASDADLMLDADDLSDLE